MIGAPKARHKTRQTHFPIQPPQLWLKITTRNCELLPLSLTVLMHTSACTITPTRTHTHKFMNTALVVAEVFRVCVLTRSRLWRSVCCTINCLCTWVTSPTTSSVSVCVSSPLWLSDSRSKWSTEEQTGLQRKDCCWEPLKLTNKGHLAPSSRTEMCSPRCDSDKCVLITGSSLLRPN